jgi:hypothetical protein
VGIFRRHPDPERSRTGKDPCIFFGFITSTGELL